MAKLQQLWICFASCAALCVLQGCGSSSTGNNGNKGGKTTVIVMRHCVRATDADGMVLTPDHAAPDYKYYDDYTSQPWPAFKAPAMWCLQRGEDILEAQGRWLKSHNSLPLPLRAIADNVPNGQRDNVTMMQLLKGLDFQPKDVSTSISNAPFGSSTAQECIKNIPSADAALKAMQNFIDANPPPLDYNEKMQSLYKAVGGSDPPPKAGNWTSASCLAGGSPWSATLPMPVGACEVAAQMVERMLMEWGGNGGPKVQPGNVDVSELPALMVLHSWYFYTWFAGHSLYQWMGASIARNVLDSVNKAEPGTTLFVGHDNNIMNMLGALELSWTPTPFPQNATLPGSMLRFDLEGGKVTASYTYVTDFSSEDGAMSTVPAVFAHTSSSTSSLGDFQDLIEKNTIGACAESSPSISSPSTITV
jgi:hypothetical protein